MRRTVNKGIWSNDLIKLLYSVFAVYIFIMGVQNYDDAVERPQRTAIQSAIAKLEELTGIPDICPSVEMCEVLFRLFHIPNDLYNLLSTKFTR
jgi:hypothetical protein